MSDLRSDLMEVRGIGESKADAILEVLDDHQPEPETPEIQGLLQDAIDYHQQEDYGFSEQYLREALKQF